MNADSFQFLSKYLLDEIYCVNDALAVTGIVYIIKTCIKCNTAILSFAKTHIWSKRNPGNFKELYGGDWAGNNNSNTNLKLNNPFIITSNIKPRN